MRIPARFAPILFGALLSIVMVGLASAFAIAITQESKPDSPPDGSEAA